MVPPCQSIDVGHAPRRGPWLLALILGWAAPAWAAAEPQLDPLGAFLAERGAFSSTATPGSAETMRNRAADLVIAAMNFIGLPYRPGGSNVDGGFDCSGFTRHIFALSLGLALPRRADEQASAGGLVRVDKADLHPGDLVFFNTLRRTFSHVGIYVGEGRFIHSPKSGSEVRIEDMRQAYWAQRYTGARRAAMAELPASGETPLSAAGH
jgi:cell wall-associated NlpC family hydrolase